MVRRLPRQGGEAGEVGRSAQDFDKATALERGRAELEYRKRKGGGGCKLWGWRRAGGGGEGHRSSCGKTRREKGSEEEEGLVEAKDGEEGDGGRERGGQRGESGEKWVKVGGFGRGGERVERGRECRGGRGEDIETRSRWRKKKDEVKGGRNEAGGVFVGDRGGGEMIYLPEDEIKGAE